MRINTKCSIAIHCLLFLHEYGETQKVTSGLLALSTGCNPVVIRSLMSALKKAGIVEITAGQGGARLCRAPENITLYQIHQAVDPGGLDNLMGVHPLPSALCPIGRSIHKVLEPSYEKLQADVKKSLKSCTLADIVAEYRKTRPQDA